MTSGRSRLIAAASELLAADPTREPTNRELFDAAGVAAPTLYHHFGTKEALLDAVVEQAFDAYLQRKQGMPRTADLVDDFAAGWDLHVAFGTANPTLYALMYAPGRDGPAAATADSHLRAALERMRAAGLLCIDVDLAASITTAAAIGCVTQLNRRHGDVDDPMTHAMRDALIQTLTGRPATSTAVAPAARALLRDLPNRSGVFTPAEQALLGQWLRTISDLDDVPQRGGQS